MYPTFKEAFSFGLLVQKRTKGFLQNQELSKFLSLRDDLQSNVNLVIAMITLKSERSPHKCTWDDICCNHLSYTPQCASTNPFCNLTKSLAYHSPSRQMIFFTCCCIQFQFRSKPENHCSCCGNTSLSEIVGFLRNLRIFENVCTFGEKNCIIKI